MMKIVLNALQYRPDGSGISVCLRELFGYFTKNTQKPCQIVLPKGSRGFLLGEYTELVEAPCTYAQSIRRILFQSFVLGRKYCKDAILLTIDSKIPLLLPKSCRVLPLVTDLAVFRMPEVYQRSRVLLWKSQYRYLRRHSVRVLAISEFTKKEITDVLGISPEQISIVPCAASDNMRQVTDPAVLSEIRKKYQLPEHYILFVGNANPRKNLERLIRAFDRLKREKQIPHELVIVGGKGWKFNSNSVLNSVENKNAIKTVGYVPDVDMAAVYSAADLFAFPTLYEGFGIPVIEAQQCGVPVLTSNVSSLPEVGGDAALYVDPLNETEIADGMSTLLNDAQLREDLVKKGFQNAERFSWEKSARLLNEVVDQIYRRA